MTSSKLQTFLMLLTFHSGYQEQERENHWSFRVNNFPFFSHSKHDRKFPSAREEREKWKNISRIDKRHQKLTHLKFLISKGRKSEKYSQLPVTASTSALQSFSSPNYSHILFQKCEEIVCNFSSFLAFVRVWNVKLHNMFNVMKNLNRGKHV